MKASKIEHAEGVKGYLMFDQETGQAFVRVYNRVERTYDDYKVCVEDLSFVIDSKYFSFVNYPDGVKQLEYTSGRKEI